MLIRGDLLKIRKLLFFTIIILIQLFCFMFYKYYEVISFKDCTIHSSIYSQKKYYYVGDSSIKKNNTICFANEAHAKDLGYTKR